MSSSQLNGIINSATRAASANLVMLNPGLRQEILKGDIKIAGPNFGGELLPLTWCELVKARSAAFSKTPVVDSKHIDSHGSERLRKRVPRVAIPVALVEQ
jgi:hypothetical protein